ncbi:MAG: HAMP domain-containing histidine kinase [Lachnospiraceae bacterium]|nr:HAMP domain-containing histidine kinase [Lachnospiraceae bacterium]
MIKKLQLKLITATMLSLFVVLVVIVGAANLVNYHKIITDADVTLKILAANEGRFPESFEEWGQKDFLSSPEFPYESRYFLIVLDRDGNIISTNIEQIAAVDESSASAYAQTVWAKGKNSGFIGNYRYIIHETGSFTYVVFLDCSRSLSNARTFALASLGASSAGMLIVFVILTLVSGKIVKPFSESYEKQKRFITDAGHELKTPLTIIDADTEILEMDYGESKWMEDIHRQTGRLTELTNDLIALSRMEETETVSLVERVSLSEIVREEADSFQALAATQNKILDSEIAPSIQVRGGGEKALRRLVSILLDNAVKYSQEGGKISVTLKNQHRAARLTVYNTTAEIKRESLPRLFDRFYRTDRSRNSKTGGYGLGLSIAASTVKAHRGKIWASTEDERSLMITVTLPVSTP